MWGKTKNMGTRGTRGVIIPVIVLLTFLNVACKYDELNLKLILGNPEGERHAVKSDGCWYVNLFDIFSFKERVSVTVFKERVSVTEFKFRFFSQNHEQKYY